MQFYVQLNYHICQEERKNIQSVKTEMNSITIITFRGVPEKVKYTLQNRFFVQKQN